MDLLFLGQIGVSLLVIILVLLQERSSGLSGIFGGGSDGGFYQTRRGLEKFVFVATIVLIVVFAGIALFNLIK